MILKNLFERKMRTLLTVFGIAVGVAAAGVFRMQYSVGLFAEAFSVALVLGIIGGVYPAWRASNLQPVEALRYE